MLRTKMMAAALTVALSVVAIPESFARGGFGGHSFGAGARFSAAHINAGARLNGGVRPFVGGVRPLGARPFIGSRFAFHHHHRRFFPIFPLAIGAGLAFGSYPYYYCDPYDPYCYNPGVVPLQPQVTADAVAVCAQRYRTYDPATHTFIGRGGRRLSCP
jgi:BA14K-like protein